MTSQYKISSALYVLGDIFLCACESHSQHGKAHKNVQKVHGNCRKGTK